MKKIAFALLVLTAALLLSSCNRSYTIRLRNGSKVVAAEHYGRKFFLGDTVCLNQYGLYDTDWSIDNSGIMKDTLTAVMRHDTIVGFDRYKIGVITK